MSMLLDILIAFLVGGLAGYLPYASLARKLRSLELDHLSFETKFIKEQRSRAAKERWDPEKDKAMLEQLAAAQNGAPPVRRNPLLKFGIGK